ncbi:hypothetical protein [Streptomyces sp. NPDC015125]
MTSDNDGRAGKAAKKDKGRGRGLRRGAVQAVTCSFAGLTIA